MIVGTSQIYYIQNGAPGSVFLLRAVFPRSVISSVSPVGRLGKSQAALHIY